MKQFVSMWLKVKMEAKTMKMASGVGRLTSDFLKRLLLCTYHDHLCTKM